MDVRRELDLINKQFDWFHKTQGMVVVWYEFIPLSSTGSTYDDVYDEGIRGSSGLRYKNGIQVPVLRIVESEDTRRQIPDARSVLQNIDLFISTKALVDSGISNPWEYETHLNDMLKYDGRYYKVYSYQVRGHLRDQVYVLVQANQTYIEQEMVNDPGPSDTLSIDLPWPTGLPSLR